MFRIDDPDNSLRVVSDISPLQTSAMVFNAPPNGDVGARIRIETERYLGPTSPVVCIDLLKKYMKIYLFQIQIQTRQGRPGPVTNLRGVPFAGNGIFLFWDPPDEPNGFVIGYQVDYKTIERYLLIRLINRRIIYRICI
jgi:hypothetical protein